MKILVSAGHGGGAAHNRGGLLFNEGDNNFYYSLVFKEEMEKFEGVQVDLIRKKITDNPEIHKRSEMGEGYDLYLSFHSNATDQNTVRGSEIFDSVEKPNKELAKRLVDATTDLFKHPNRGVKYREGSTKGYNYYGELRFNEAKSSMIIEAGFHTNIQDSLYFKNNHRLIAIAHAKEIANFYKLKKEIDSTLPLIIKGKVRKVKGHIIDGVSYVRISNLDVPLRPLGEALGFKVGWDNSTKSVIFDE